MIGRRAAYFASLGGSFLIFLLFDSRLSEVLFLTVLFLPVLSLLVSLPGMLTVKATIQCPKRVCLGTAVYPALSARSVLPLPPYTCVLECANSLTGIVRIGAPGVCAAAEHCGAVKIRCKKLDFYDYLGLFRRRIRNVPMRILYVTPDSVPMALPENAEQTARVWRPKPGGGFSENHDLRPYRPGDDLRNLHWKMSAKTGSYILREPIEPADRYCDLILTLSGTPEETDRKLGRFLYCATALLRENTPHRLYACTGEGTLCREITDTASLTAAMDALLESTRTVGEWTPPGGDSGRQCRIGGNADEG